VGKFIPADFPFDWLRTEIAQYKRARPYYYGNYYPILPCSANADCVTPPDSERSAAFEWAAWQFNRPQEGDGMIQAFRRDRSDDSMKQLRLRGLDPAAMYEITNVDEGPPRTVSGAELMQQGLHLKIPDKPGAAIIFYTKTF
jgi:alpha-galactosidase